MSSTAVGRAEEQTLAAAQDSPMKQLAVRLAPVIRFHPQEAFFPSTVEWFLARCSLTKGRGDATWARAGRPIGINLTSSMSLLKAGPLSAADLVNAARAEPGGPRNTEIGLWPMDAQPGQRPAYSHKLSDFYFSDYQLETLAGQLKPAGAGKDVTGAACYVHMCTTADYTLINYYFFCPYNGAMGRTTTWDAIPLASPSAGGGFGAHVGDWMRVGARATMSSGKASLLGVEFDHHGATSFRRDPQFTFTEVRLDQVQSLTAWSAWHSHEMYYKADPWSLPIKISGNDYTDDEGAHWVTRSNLVFLDDPLAPAWIEYNGTFGNNLAFGSPGFWALDISDAYFLTTGPAGPAFKSDWTRGPDYVPGGEIWQTARTAGAGWRPQWLRLADVEQNDPGTFVDLSCAGVSSQSGGQELQLVGVMEDGTLWHTLRDGTRWQQLYRPLKDVERFTPDQFETVACAGTGDELQVLGLTDLGRILQTTRYANTSWQSEWSLVTSAPNTDPGPFFAISCAGIGTQLHVIGLTRDDGMWLAIRDAVPTWRLPFTRGQPLGHNAGPFIGAACAGVSSPTGDQLHVVGLDAEGQLWHTIGNADGSWTQPFKAIAIEAGNPGQFDVTACAGVGAQLHVLALTGDGQLWYSIRNADETWQRFMNVQSGPTVPNPFVAAACASVNNQLEIVGIA